MTKIPLKEKEDLIKYLDGAIEHVNNQMEPLRDKLKFLSNEKGKLQRIRKCIK